jgi:hypothetical protein
MSMSHPGMAAVRLRTSLRAVITRSHILGLAYTASQSRLSLTSVQTCSSQSSQVTVRQGPKVLICDTATPPLTAVLHFLASLASDSWSGQSIPRLLARRTASPRRVAPSLRNTLLR